MHLHPVLYTGDRFEITHRKPFQPDNRVSFNKRQKALAISSRFAERISEKQRTTRSGGTAVRDGSQKLKDITLGKYAEIVLYTQIFQKGTPVEPPDLAVYQKGIWDSYDMRVANRILSIKASKHFANLMLLETRDYDLQGYRHAEEQPEWFVFIRINPNDYNYDIPGYATLNDLRDAITAGHIIRQGSMLNGRIRMDADNWYIQAGDLRPFSQLHKYLHEESLKLDELHAKCTGMVQGQVSGQAGVGKVSEMADGKKAPS